MSDAHHFWIVAKAFAETGHTLSEACATCDVSPFGLRVVWADIVARGIATRAEIDALRARMKQNQKRQEDAARYERIGPRKPPTAAKAMGLPDDPEAAWRAAMEGKRFDALRVRPHVTTRFNGVHRAPVMPVGSGSTLADAVQQGD